MINYPKVLCYSRVEINLSCNIQTFLPRMYTSEFRNSYNWLFSSAKCRNLVFYQSHHYSVQSCWFIIGCRIEGVRKNFIQFHIQFPIFKHIDNKMSRLKGSLYWIKHSMIIIQINSSHYFQWLGGMKWRYSITFSSSKCLIYADLVFVGILHRYELF